MNCSLHIISFDVPFPANYGGVIDVFYKIKALHAAGVKIYLHCFENPRTRAPELEQYCSSVQYYPRKSGLKANLGLKPYIVQSRLSVELLENLLNDRHPILFEGLHTCGIINDPRLKGRLLIYRESNIEHHYYHHLFKAERHPGKKLFFLVESFRLKIFQSALTHASVMLTVSKEDTQYLQAIFPGKRVIYLPSFNGHQEVNILPGIGKYALYQGKLSVAENSRAAEFLINKIWDESFPELVIAGLNPPSRIKKLAETRKNIRIIENPSDQMMFRLIQQAHINILVTFQATGLKLKLLNALYNGRFCLVNPDMAAGTSLGQLCLQATRVDEFKQIIPSLFQQVFSESMISDRKLTLLENYSDHKNCNQLIDILTLPA